MKYVQNTTQNKVNVQVHYNSLNGDTEFGKPKQVVIIFRPETIDTVMGRVQYTGYTPVDDNVLEALMNDKSFRYAIDPKIGWLTIHEGLPDSAQTPTDALIVERGKTSELMARVMELEGMLAEKGDPLLKADLSSAKETITQLQTTLADQAEQIDLANTAADQIAALNNQIANLNAELAAAKQGQAQ